jgi:RimJ/RimL family protein N-acetyltransferase
MSLAALPVLRTPRLTLRPLTLEDADSVAEGIGNFDVSKWLAVVPYPYGRDDAEHFILQVQNSGKPFWAICDADGLRGIVCLDDELAYWLARPVWGRGYGFEAAHAVVRYWFSDRNAGDLVSGYFEGNDRSGRLLKALGFTFEETRVRHARSFRQDVVSNRMRLTRKGWEARQGFTLYTPRLTIRPMQARDAASLAAMAVPDVARNLSTIPVGMSVSAAEDYIAASGYKGVPGFRLAIERDGRMIGGLGFGGTPLSVAYFLAPDHWAQGIASEALSAFLPALFERIPVSRIEAEVFEDNIASMALLRKFGFKETGRGLGESKGRLEPAPVITYAVTRETLRVAA